MTSDSDNRDGPRGLESRDRGKSDAPVRRQKFPLLGVSIFPSPERDALCKRLGIEIVAPKDATGLLLGNLHIWAAIGMKLAENEPEFTGQTGKRGRPKKKSEGQKTDYTRAVIIRRLRAHLKTENDGRKWTDKALVERANKAGHPDFIHGEIYALTRSVSRGNGIIRNALTEFREGRAEYFRLSLEKIRRRDNWIKSVEPDARRLEKLNGLQLSLLCPEMLEKIDLQIRLLKPSGGNV